MSKIKKGQLYKLDSKYLKCLKISDSGKTGTFVLTDKYGDPELPEYKKSHVDHKTRVINKRLNELIPVTMATKSKNTKPFSKVHKLAKAANSHAAKIKARGGTVTRTKVKGGTKLVYSFKNK